MKEFKDAIFLYETHTLAEELKVVDGIAEEFDVIPGARSVLLQVSHRLEHAAPMIDDFKARTCGSPYSLAIINLNMFHLEELNFILRPAVLGDPRTIFLASLKYMVGDAYALARDKSLRESNDLTRTPSCIDCYAEGNRDAVYSRVSSLAMAYLTEAEERLLARQQGTQVLERAATEALKKSGTTFFGKAMKSGLMPAVRMDAGGVPAAVTASGKYKTLDPSLTASGKYRKLDPSFAPPQEASHSTSGLRRLDPALVPPPPPAASPSQEAPASVTASGRQPKTELAAVPPPPSTAAPLPPQAPASVTASGRQQPKTELAAVSPPPSTVAPPPQQAQTPASLTASGRQQPKTEVPGSATPAAPTPGPAPTPPETPATPSSSSTRRLRKSWESTPTTPPTRTA